MSSVKILFNTLSKIEHSDADSSEPLSNINELLQFIYNKENVARRFKLSKNKFGWLEYLRIQNNIIGGYFSSGSSKKRLPLVDEDTLNERDNPKSLTEGEKEKTHFAIKVTQEDVYLIAQHNFQGFSVINMISYLKHFVKDYELSIDNHNNYSIIFSKIGSNNFLTELERLKRTALAEVTMDKRLLGSDALNFSNRTTNVQENIVLVAKASKSFSMPEFAIDLFNKMTRQESPISKIRIKGKDEEDNDILIDTDLICKIEFIEVDKDNITGELNSQQILQKLEDIARNI